MWDFLRFSSELVFDCYSMRTTIREMFYAFSSTFWMLWVFKWMNGIMDDEDGQGFPDILMMRSIFYGVLLLFYCFNLSEPCDVRFSAILVRTSIRLLFYAFSTTFRMLWVFKWMNGIMDDEDGQGFPDILMMRSIFYGVLLLFYCLNLSKPCDVRFSAILFRTSVRLLFYMLYGVMVMRMAKVFLIY